MTRSNRLGFVVTLGALAAVSAMAVDICIPAQPRIADALGAQTGAGAALVGGYLLGYGPGQLVWGPLADRFGRLPPLLVSLAGFIAAGAVCATTGSFEVLIAARAAQGAMGGAAPVIARAIARDQGGGSASAALLSTMMVILGAAPLLAPAVGSGLLTLFSWPALFWSLVVFGIATAIASLVFLPAYLPAIAPRPLSPARVIEDSRGLFREADFRVGLGISSAIFSGYAALLAMGAAVTAEHYGVTAEAFGPVFTIAASAFVLGSVAARQALGRHGVETVLTLGSAIAGVSGLLLLATLAWRPELPVFWGVVSLYVLAFGMILPCATAKALEPAGAMAGTGSSLIGLIQTMAGATGAALAPLSLFADSFHGLVWVMAGGALLCAAIRGLSLGRCNTRRPRPPAAGRGPGRRR